MAVANPRGTKRTSFYKLRHLDGPTSPREVRPLGLSPGGPACLGPASGTLELKLPAAFDEQFADVKLRIQAVTHAAETI